MLLALVLTAGAVQAADCPGLAERLAAIDASSACLTMPLLQAWRAARELGQEACLAAALDARDLPAAVPPATFPFEPLPLLPDKALRDTYRLPNSLESDDFVVWWGNSGNVDDEDVEELLEAFQEGWTYLVDGFDLNTPYGTSSYKFNVYLGDTGSGAPSSYGNSGYYTVDGDGYPMIVVAAGSLEDLDWGRTTAVHEFFHAVQHATGAFQTDVGAWIWEACSTWVEGQVYPDVPYYAAFLFGFAFLPHLPLDFYDYPDSGAIEEYHQYGAFIFVRYLSEIAASETLVRDLWDAGTPYDDPLVELDDLLVDEGTTLEATWTDFLAHNAVWDYRDGEIYAWYLDWSADYYDDYRVVETLDGEGSPEWRTPTQRLPQRYGAQFVELRYPSAGTLHVEVEGDAQGSAGSPARWVGTVVLERFSPEYVAVPFEGGVGSVVIEDTSGFTSAWLALGVSTEEGRNNETFGYSYRLWVEGDGPVDTGAGDSGEPERPKRRGGGCGCGGAALGSLWPLALGLLALPARRRRR